MMRAVRLAIALLIAATGPLNAQTDVVSTMVHVGIRTEARPFAYFDTQTQTYEGLLADLCLEAVQKAGFQMTTHPMTAGDRDLLLTGGTGMLSSGAEDLDLMCDPTTVTLKRLDLMAEQALSGAEVSRDFSPIVFLANGSYIERRASKTEEENKTVLGVLDTAPANAAEACVFAPGQTLASTSYFRTAGVVQTTTANNSLVYAVRRELLVLPEKTAVCAVSFPDHVALIRAFCGNELAYYFGDLDIMRAYHSWFLQSAGLKAEANCPMQEAARPVSYEPYAFVVSSRVPGFRQRFNRALYAIFHDGKTVGEMSLHFGENKTLSPFVQTLFRINKVPSGYPPRLPGLPAAAE